MCIGTGRSLSQAWGQGSRDVSLFLFALLIVGSAVLTTFGPLMRNLSIGADTKPLAYIDDHDLWAVDSL